MSCVSRPPTVVPQRPRLTEYAVVFSETGNPRSRRYTAVASRERARLRIGVITAMSPARMRTATSKRTWSLPAPVEPWAMARRAGLARHLDDRPRLRDALRPDAERVDLAAPHVALDEVLQRLAPQIGAGVDGDVARGAELSRARGDLGELRRVEAAGVDGHGDDVLSRRLPQVRDAEAGVEAAGEGEDDGHRKGRGCGEWGRSGAAETTTRTASRRETVRVCIW